MPTFGTRNVVSVVLMMLTFIISVYQSESRYVCPEKFVLLRKKCYYFSNDEATWQDAHFKCLNFNSTLATITRPQQELTVRSYLNRHSQGQYERWLGGKFNQKQSRWVWGIDGKPVDFHGFSRMNPNDRNMWIWHCIILDPARQNKWGARSCVFKRRYVCQKLGIRSKNIKRSRCNSKNQNNSNEICTNKNLGNVFPGYLVKKPKRKQFNPTTFVCPAHMILVGRKCYYFSTNKTTWSNAYWACRDNGTNLAIITTRMQDNILRGFLNGNFTEKHERWIGGIFDWKQNKWKWAKSGKIIKYKNFAKPALKNKDQAQHCITLDPQFKNLWNSKNRLEDKHYICQAKSKSVVKYVPSDKLQQPNATVIVSIQSNTLSSLG